jgi:hypothetical protein
MSINTNPESVDDAGVNSRAGAIAMLVAFIVAPPVVIAGIAMWWLFSLKRFRIRRSVLAAGTGIFILLTAPFYGLLIPLTIRAWTQTLPSIIHNELSPVSGYFLMVLQQLALTLPLGAIIGLIYCSYRWYGRARWEEWDFRLAPWEIWTRKRHIEDIVYDRNAPATGSTLGVTRDGRKIIQSLEEASMHSFVSGASGAGKTTTLLASARDSIRQGHGYLFVDMKNSPVVTDTLYKYAKRYGRNFYHFTLLSQGQEYKGPAENGPSYYDPIAHGDATRRKDLLVDIRDYGANGGHYKMLTENYLQMAFSVLIETQKKGVSTFSDLSSLMEPKELEKRAAPLGRVPQFRELVTAITAFNEGRIERDMESTIVALRAQLSTLFLSSAGQWIRLDPDTKRNNNIDLYEVVKNGDVVVFSLDSQNYPSLAPLIGTLVIQDLKTLASDLLNNPVNNTMVTVLDEFASIGNMNIINLINKARESSMPVTLSTQVIGDLDRVDPTFAKSLFGIINCFMIHRATTERDATEFASLTGTVTRKKFRQSVEHRTSFFGFGRAAGTGGGTTEDVEEYLIMPQEIRKLGSGNMIYVAGAQQRVERVTVIREAQNLDRILANEETASGSAPEVKEAEEHADDLELETAEAHESTEEPQRERVVTPVADDMFDFEPLPGLEDDKHKPDVKRSFDGSFNLGKPSSRTPFPGPALANPFLKDEAEDMQVARVAVEPVPAVVAAPTPQVEEAEPVKPVRKPAPQPIEFGDGFDIVKPATPRPPRKSEEPSRYEF